MARIKPREFELLSMVIEDAVRYIKHDSGRYLDYDSVHEGLENFFLMYVF
jgi:hypothetical protein